MPELQYSITYLAHVMPPMLAPAKPSECLVSVCLWWSMQWGLSSGLVVQRPWRRGPHWLHSSRRFHPPDPQSRTFSVSGSRTGFAFWSTWHPPSDRPAHTLLDLLVFSVAACLKGRCWFPVCCPQTASTCVGYIGWRWDADSEVPYRAVFTWHYCSFTMYVEIKHANKCSQDTFEACVDEEVVYPSSLLKSCTLWGHAGAVLKQTPFVLECRHGALFLVAQLGYLEY